MNIGIAGSQNSHARAFAAMLNHEKGWDGRTVAGAAVTHIIGDSEEEARALANDCRIPNVCATPEEMIGEVDAVFCLDRRGSRHAEQARPFLAAGLPVFVDKPLAADPAGAHAILDEAERSGSILCSFSTVPFCAQMRAYVEEIASMTEPPAAIQVIAHADPDCEYDGIAFYAIHSAAIVHALAGPGCESVAANVMAGQIMAVCRYEKRRTATMLLSPSIPHDFQLTMRGRQRSEPMKKLDISDCHAEGLKEILAILSGKQAPPTREQVLEPLEIVAATVRSIKEGREVHLSEFRP